MSGNDTIRLKVVCNVLKNPFNSIFDGFIVVKLLGRVYQRNLNRPTLTRLSKYGSIQTIGLPHTAAYQIATICPLVELFWCREEQANLHLLGRFGIDNISERVDKATTTLLEESSYGTKGG